MSSPVVEELTPAPDVYHALRALAHWPGAVLLESALLRDDVGRYSFLTAKPCQVIREQSPTYGSDPCAHASALLPDWSVETVPELPPFQGGVVGLMSYDAGRYWERLPVPVHDELGIPAIVCGLYDWVLAWDHVQDRAWIIAHGLTHEAEESVDLPAAQKDRAAQRVRQVRDALAVTPRLKESPFVLPPTCPLTAPQVPLDLGKDAVSNFSREQYLQAVQRVIDYVHAGDVFQVNLSQRLMFPARTDPLSLYGRLRECNPAPFAAYFADEDWAIVSASPERFLRLRDGQIETRPIKGTRQRRSGPEADLFTRDELRESNKDQSENVMIVDLLRNDLSRVCRPGSIRVPKLCAVESYETVQHLVSQVRGQLQEGETFGTLLAACFPGGSITGAPKIRAMEIINELEEVARGPYCGSIFYCGFDGTADSSILIRTFTQRSGWIACPVGGGIVAQSDPNAEYEETLHKAEGMLRAL